jgi:hypothetical protein
MGLLTSIPSTDDINLYRICGMANSVALKRFEEPTQVSFREALTQLNYFSDTEVRDMMFEFDNYLALVRAVDISDVVTCL